MLYEIRVGIPKRLGKLDGTGFDDTWTNLMLKTRCDNINCKLYYQIRYYLNIFIELSSKSSASKMLKIQDDEQNKVKNETEVDLEPMFSEFN